MVKTRPQPKQRPRVLAKGGRQGSGAEARRSIVGSQEDCSPRRRENDERRGGRRGPLRDHVVAWRSTEPNNSVGRTQFILIRDWWDVGLVIVKGVERLHLDCVHVGHACSVS